MAEEGELVIVQKKKDTYSKILRKI